MPIIYDGKNQELDPLIHNYNQIVNIFTRPETKLRIKEKTAAPLK